MRSHREQRVQIAGRICCRPYGVIWCEASEFSSPLFLNSRKVDRCLLIGVDMANRVASGRNVNGRLLPLLGGQGVKVVGAPSTSRTSVGPSMWASAPPSPRGPARPPVVPHHLAGLFRCQPLSGGAALTPTATGVEGCQLRRKDPPELDPRRLTATPRHVPPFCVYIDGEVLRRSRQAWSEGCVGYWEAGSGGSPRPCASAIFCA